MEFAAGADHTLGIKTDGSLWGWGYGWAAGANRDDDDDNRQFLPHPTRIGEGYRQVKADSGLSVALKTDGTLMMWGGGSYGTSGNPSIGPTPRPIGQDFATLLDVGGGLKSDGSLWFWGAPQLPPTGATIVQSAERISRTRPTQVGSGYQRVAVGNGYVLGLKTDGSLWAWGHNRFGKLGNGNTETQYAPVQIGSGFQAVAASSSSFQAFYYGHSLALTTEGQLFAWGNNEHGQLGLGDRIDRLVPTPVGQRFRAISAGEFHSIGIKDDDTLWAWGNNQFGRLGNGTEADQPSPVLIGSGFVAAQAYTDRSVGIKRDGSIWVWGNWPYPVKKGGVFPNKQPDIFLSIGKYLSPKLLTPGNGPVSETDYDRAILPSGFGAALQIEIDRMFFAGLTDVADLFKRGSPQFVKTLIGNQFISTPGRFLLGADGSLWEEEFPATGGTFYRNAAPSGFRDIAGNFNTVAAIGTDDSLWIWGNASTGQIPVPAIPYFIVPRHSVILDPPETQKAVCLFDWAQVVYPTLFNPPGNLHESSTAPGASYLFRAFPGTQSFLGVSDGVLYYLGPASNNTIARIGLVADWLERAACD